MLPANAQKQSPFSSFTFSLPTLSGDSRHFEVARLHLIAFSAILMIFDTRTATAYVTISEMLPHKLRLPDAISPPTVAAGPQILQRWSYRNVTSAAISISASCPSH
jgi:hypothetical protein